MVGAVVALVPLEHIDSFIRVRDVPHSQITSAHLLAVRALDEREELEPRLRQILFDANRTSGPRGFSAVLQRQGISPGGCNGRDGNPDAKTTPTKAASRGDDLNTSITGPNHRQ
jgi:hypothetical protein